MKIKKKMILIIAIIEILALALGIQEYLSNKDFNGEIKRPGVEEAETDRELIVSSKWGKDEINIRISPKSRSKKEIENLLNKAKEEIDNTVCGGNKSLDYVTEDLDIRETYQGGLVACEWAFDNYGVLDSAGHIIYKNITEKTIVKAICNLNCEGIEEVYSFNIAVASPSVSTESGYKYLLNADIEELDKNYRDIAVVRLPDTIEGLELSWRNKSSNRGIELGIFGIVAGLLIPIMERERRKNKERIRQKELTMDYPEIVSMLNLYIGAGISTVNAIERIVSSYRKREENNSSPRPGFEELLILSRKIQEGKGEIECYKTFGKQIRHKDYRKLSIILVQNVRKGTASLVEQLEKEERQAFEERKLRAKITGEEASTKLLLPMAGLLMIVLITLIFPAMMGIGI